jgi:hypothetical protein
MAGGSSSSRHKSSTPGGSKAKRHGRHSGQSSHAGSTQRATQTPEPFQQQQPDYGQFLESPSQVYVGRPDEGDLDYATSWVPEGTPGRSPDEAPTRSRSPDKASTRSQSPEKAQTQSLPLTMETWEREHSELAGELRAYEEQEGSHDVRDEQCFDYAADEGYGDTGSYPPAGESVYQRPSAFLPDESGGQEQDSPRGGTSSSKDKSKAKGQDKGKGKEKASSKGTHKDSPGSSSSHSGKAGPSKRGKSTERLSAIGSQSWSSHGRGQGPQPGYGQPLGYQEHIPDPSRPSDEDQPRAVFGQAAEAGPGSQSQKGTAPTNTVTGQCTYCRNQLKCEKHDKDPSTCTSCADEDRDCSLGLAEAQQTGCDECLRHPKPKRCTGKKVGPCGRCKRRGIEKDCRYVKREKARPCDRCNLVNKKPKDWKPCDRTWDKPCTRCRKLHETQGWKYPGILDLCMPKVKTGNARCRYCMENEIQECDRRRDPRCPGCREKGLHCDYWNVS